MYEVPEKFEVIDAKHIDHRFQEFTYKFFVKNTMQSHLKDIFVSDFRVWAKDMITGDYVISYFWYDVLHAKFDGEDQRHGAVGFDGGVVLHFKSSEDAMGFKLRYG